jgi:hypothetical protein
VSRNGRFSLFALFGVSLAFMLLLMGSLTILLLCKFKTAAEMSTNRERRKNSKEGEGPAESKIFEEFGNQNLYNKMNF